MHYECQCWFIQQLEDVVFPDVANVNKVGKILENWIKLKPKQFVITKRDMGNDWADYVSTLSSTLPHASKNKQLVTHKFSNPKRAQIAQINRI